MDGSDGNNPSNGGSPTSPPQQQQQQQRIHPGDSSRAVRAELEARRRATVERQRRYAPGAHEQIGRVFGDITPAWYARLRLLSPLTYARIAEAGVLGLSVAHDRPLGDAEARAVAEHAAAGADRMALVGWGLAGAALLMTWRGRHTLRFPLWTPQVVPPPRGAYLRQLMWHGARYVAYSAALGVTVRAPLLAYSAVYEQGQMRKDPRLRALLREGGDDEHGQGGFSPGEQESGGGEGWNDVAQYKASYTGEDTQQQQQQQSSWETYKQTTQQQQPPPPQQYGQSTQSQGSAGWGSSSSSSSSGWDSSDFDDASPVAASAQNAGSAYGNNSSGSAWDRLRRQSQGASPQQQQQQQQQRQPPPPPSSSGGWGDSGDGADRAAQDRAQRDFDQLVERDRQGQQGQGRSGWGDR